MASLLFVVGVRARVAAPGGVLGSNVGEGLFQGIHGLG